MDSLDFISGKAHQPNTAMQTVPAVRRPRPIQALSESFSFRTSTEKRTVTRMLTRSMGTT